MLPSPLVSAAWLRAHLHDPRLQIVDCRFDLSDPTAGRRLYLRGHIPGAAFLDMETDLSAPKGDGTRGRHPLPHPDTFTTAARRAGIRGDASVVAYDQGMTGGAARLWWLLRHFGKDEVAVLDGGLAGWDGPLEAGEHDVQPGDFTAQERTEDTISAEELLATLGQQERLLLDARAPERYRGEVEPLDPVAGHIPGARNLPFADALRPPDDVLAHRGDVVVYCGSGVTACVAALGLAAAGREDVKLYPGSWSEWATRGLPVERG